MWRKRPPRTWTTAAALAGVSLAVAVMALAQVHPVRSDRNAGLVPALPVFINVPYPAGTQVIGYSPNTFAAGVGGLAWIPVGGIQNVATGKVVIDAHANANPGGHYGGVGGQSGFSVAYACGAACGGSPTVTFHWTGNWYTQVTVNCYGGAQGGAEAIVSFYGQVWTGNQLVAQTVLTPSDLFSGVVGPTIINNGAIPNVVVNMPGPGTVAGTNYVFVGFAWVAADADCTANASGAAGTYAEADVGNQFAVTEPQISLP